MISSKPPNILFPNLVLWCIIMNRSVRQKDCFAIFKVKFTARAQMIKIWQFLSYLLNCWSFCYWTWFDSTLSYARVFYGDIGLLCSRSKSQQNFKICINVCPDGIFWIAEPFTTKLGMVMHHYEPDCLSERSSLLSSRSRSQLRIIWSKYDFLIYYLNCWFFYK